MTRNLRLLVAALTLAGLTAAAVPATASSDSETGFDPRHPTLRGSESPVLAMPIATMTADSPDSPGSASVLGEWTRVPRTSAVATGGSGIAFDAERGELLSFGGC